MSPIPVQLLSKRPRTREGRGEGTLGQVSSVIRERTIDILGGNKPDEGGNKLLLNLYIPIARSREQIIEVKYKMWTWRSWRAWRSWRVTQFSRRFSKYLRGGLEVRFTYMYYYEVLRGEVCIN